MFYNTNKRLFKQIEKSDGALYRKGYHTDTFQVWIIVNFFLLTLALFFKSFLVVVFWPPPGISVRAGTRDFLQATRREPLATFKGSRRKIDPKELPCCSLPLLQIAYTQQLKILVTTLLSTHLQIFWDGILQNSTRLVKTEKIVKFTRVRCYFVKFDIYFHSFGYR